NDLNYDTEESGVQFQIQDNPVVLAPITTNLLNAKSSLSVFTFTGATGDEATFSPDNQPTNVIVGDISRGTNLVAQTYADAFNARNWPTGALDSDSYYEFSITANSGYDFNISSIEVDHRRSGTGPISWVVRSSVDGYTADIDGFFSTPNEDTWFTNEEIDFGIIVQNETSVTVRLYAYNADGGLGTWTIDNLAIYGTIADIQAPSFTATYPQSDSARIDGFHLYANVDEPVSAYYLIKNTGDPIPTDPLDVINGIGGVLNDMITIDTQDSTYREIITGLTVALGYDIYWVLDDGTNPTIINATQNNIRTSDNDADVTAPGTQITSATIPATADSVAEAIDVFAFVINDDNVPTNLDGSPTNVSKIWIKNALATDWTSEIGGITLSGSTIGNIPIMDIRVSADSIVADIDPASLSVQDQGNETITMGVYLLSSGIADGASLQFEISQTDPNQVFETSFYGSQFTTPFAPATITSNVHTMDVSADR
ncbi:MAG: hypothetical protein KAQ62_23895, partial [Cyclobacteriaceae bacterium]|nr:hypothetical protein [Cyclobacteriaceae bacterium]